MNKQYRVLYSKNAEKSLSKLDKPQANLLVSWISKNLNNCENPRYIGKSLKGILSELWSYRVGSYRILANIEDDKIIINIVAVGHRKDVYD
jgi:mRNA interferase RelE/StbE